jgi:hypothetical protein
MSSFPYKNPISSEQLNGVQSVQRSEVFGTNFSVLSVGGYMEVFNTSDLIYTINGLGPIEYSGNTIPIDFLKGTGDPWSPDVLTLNSDNISSGRRRLGMLVYVYENDQTYQFRIDNYESLWSAATASTGTVVISDFGTTVYNSSVDGQNFINAWTASTIEDISGATHSSAVWKKYSTGGGSGSTSADTLYITGAGVNSTVRCGVNNTAKGDYGASLGGSGNTASGNYSFVGGGLGNSSSGNYSFVGGGGGNTSSNYFSTIGGGGFNTSSGFYSTIGGGRCNTSSFYNSTVSGGYCNTSSSKYSTTSGGFKNTSSGCQSTIGGGLSNIASSDNSTIGGGAGNIVSGYTSTISGGYSNTLSGPYSFVGGGTSNTSSAYYSFIGGGTQNTISGYPSIGPSFSSILNGCLNTISGTSKIGSYSLIIGGCNNFVSDSFIGVFGSNIVASCPNTFYTNDFCSCGSIYSSALSSGQAVCAGTNGLLTNYTPVSPVIIEGSCTTSSIRCGVGNNATASFSASLAGTGNTSSGFASVVVGGAFNNSCSTYSFVGGGVGNRSCGNLSSVVGGNLNTACCSSSFIGGGIQNLVSGSTSSVVGGFCNIAGGNCSFIGGGNSNIITSGGSFSFIGTGRGNTVSGNYGMVLGGSGNTVTGSFSSAIGRGLNATANCTLYTNNIITGGFSATTISASTVTTSFTTGSVIFQGSGGTLSQNNSQLFWDNINTGLILGGGSLDSNQILQNNSTKGIRISGTGAGFGYSLVRGSEIAGLATNTTFSLLYSTTELRFETAANERMRIASTGNVLISTTTDAGFKLDVNGSTRVQNTVEVIGNGRYKFGAATGLYATTDNGASSNSGSGNLFLGYYTTSDLAYAGTSVTLGRVPNISLSATSGLQEMVRVTGNFAPTSGTGLFTALQLNNTINQTGGSSGITRGLYVSPTLTSAADFRAIEVERGKVILNSISGNTLIGTTADTGTYKLDVRGLTRFSASTGTSLTVISSGNSTSAPVFSVQGSQGELFSVTDSLTGSLFSVSDISGLPIIEVFSDSTTIIGDYQAPSLYTTKRVSSITATTGTTIYSFPTSAYTSSFVDYYVSGATGLRAGNMMAIWSGSTVNFTETSTNDIGVTTPVTFGYVMSGSSAVLRASASTGTWIVESILRGL